MDRVAVTGAGGSVGRTTLAGLEPTAHDVVPITHREHDDIDGVVADITDGESMRRAFEGCDTIVHLAGNPDPDAEWGDLLAVNIDGTRTVYDAAAAADVDRVVFASTNHVTHGHALPQGGTWDEMVADPAPVHIDDENRPDSFYAVSKICGEALGSLFSHRHGIEVLDLRIGWLLTREELADLHDEQSLLDFDTFRQGPADYARATWLSPRDCRHAMRRAITAELPERHVTLNLCSRNTERFYSLVDTMRLIGYEPRDDSAEAVDRSGGD